MKKSALTLLSFILGILMVNAQIVKPEASEVWEPEPEVVTPGTTAQRKRILEIANYISNGELHWS